MAEFRLHFLEAAIRDLKRLDKPVAQRIIRRINWMTANYDRIKPEGLSGQLSGLCKLRVGSYRVLYQFIEDEQLILIHHIGHRTDIYRIQ